uniref:Midasin n=1 Tax=Astyanax mexicanus TaxID=7994 RepID=A0A8B9KV40_ASTMX
TGKKNIWSQQDRQCILGCLAQLLLEKDYTLLLARHLRPLILDLLERNAERIKTDVRLNHDLHERLCVALSKLLSVSPDAQAFAARYFNSAPPVFQRLFFTSEESASIQYGPRRMKLRDLMGATLRFLQSDCEKFRVLWDWSACISQLLTSDVMVRGYTAQCLALVSHMTDNQKTIFLRKVLSSEEILHLKMKSLEEAQQLEVERALVLANQGSVMWRLERGNKFSKGQVVSEDLSQTVTAVCGVILPRLTPRREEQVRKKNLVLVDSSCRNLRRLAMAVASQKPVLLEGPIGCGKTALVEYLAPATGHVKAPDILKVQLGDQTDSKMLLGMYRCTDIPGKFVWQPGSLTQAVSKGHWILLEDIDHAPLDVISVLLPLMENKKLTIPGREDCIQVAPGFQFFATRRMFYSGGAWHRPQNTHAALLDKYWNKLQIGNMTRDELKLVLVHKYPSLTTVVDRLLDIYCQLTGDRHHISVSSSLQNPSEEKPTLLEGRGLSLRDLLKWCDRICMNFDNSSSATSQNVFLEALDCFTAMLSKVESRLKLAEIIGSKLNISKEKAHHYCQLYQPGIIVTELEVTVGRGMLLRKQCDVVRLETEKQTFAATRPSSVLLEQLAVCVTKGEPVLLVGETGTGKTSTVQYLAGLTGHKLRVVNMNQQSDTADLLGGYKPVDHKLILLPLREAFEDLFSQTYSRKQNITFLGHVQTCFRGKRWQDLLKLMDHVCKSALTKELQDKPNAALLQEQWEALALKLSQTQEQIRARESALVFAFVEGTLAQAVKKGEWILLDEINLAAPETLECLSGLLEGSAGSLVLLDRGDTEPLVRHSDFRLFACMNPATDVGKRNLPLGIRNRFTELYVEELESEGDLRILVSDYLKGLNLNRSIIHGVISFYLAVRKEANSRLVDGTGHKPHYSLRTLCRALKYVAANPCYSIQRSLYEGFCLSFLTQLDRSSHPIVEKLVYQYILGGNIKSLKQPIPEPRSRGYVQMEGYWVSQGDMDPALDPSYILTPSVRLNLRDLARVVAAGIHPVLIQGETSVGKTSLVRWLAAATGNQCVRINNHEHTDIQEYIGCYSSDEHGKLVFKEGVLIDAMRKGYWIILDELNLAPTDVLEALNRLLDDNRELFIAETQEVVKAHPRFMLFATQNPPGLYGGRKVLSRAFRNRFVELHFDELPSEELETILHQRCSLPPSYCTKLVKVMQNLQSLRRGSSVFAGKHGFITLRDLFRWAERYRLEEQTDTSRDWLQHLANDGYMLLAGRVRRPEEALTIQNILEKHFKRTVNPEALFSEDQVTSQTEVLSEFGHVVWTEGMRRLAVLVGRALRFGESVLLVGDTGCGKTTICQLFAALAGQKFFSVNCHLHMETSDFLGGLRPVRHGDAEDGCLFEWRDGPLVLAMRQEGVFLMDEISLADDSVLERLNSVLETEKSLVLAEKGSGDDDDVELIIAGKKFRLVATMNPGGDFGKKELSPALRNRFTEIWCPQTNSRSDLMKIIQHNLRSGLSLDQRDHQGKDIAELMLDFIDWLTNQEFGRRCILSVRDILSWVDFMNTVCEQDEVEEPEWDQRLDTVTAFIHAACLVYVDGIGSGTTVSAAENASAARKASLAFLESRLRRITELDKKVQDALRVYETIQHREPRWGEDFFGIEPFYIMSGPESEGRSVSDYALGAGTTAVNAMRVLRALKLQRPILLEGSPGVGKTSLVAALAKASGNHLIRINLSEQTDVTDLFGTDLPVEGGKGGEFAWRDGPLLAALKAGHWIVLDELNLASQSVLEGLNACFDHRAEIYIPELSMRFHVQQEKTKIFGCQNPFTQGGGRKGLPKSFLNRFTQVFVDQLTSEDMQFIGNSIFPNINEQIISKMVQFSNKLVHEVTVERKWGQKGGPWEFNLRDLFRWCQLMQADQSPAFYNPGQHVGLVYADRMRTEADKAQVLSVFRKVFTEDFEPYMGSRQFHITPLNLQVGSSVLQRSGGAPVALDPPLSITHQVLRPLESIMKCVKMGWMAILVGPTASGKSSLVHLLALLTGHRLRVMAMNSAMDTTELLGGFEQVDIIRPWQQVLESMDYVVAMVTRRGLMSLDGAVQDTEFLLSTWSTFRRWLKDEGLDSTEGTVTFEALNKLEVIIVLLHKLNTKLKVFTDMSKLQLDFTLLKERLAQMEDGWSHGGFEWLDGTLVQALQAGDWLLMDNVNFCSPSVLDRLNALLEPGGSLTINERGVIDGTTPSITPHPNFRLFLTMDPAHGEISRAMRNRGVEIYIPGENEGVCWDSLDLKTVLHTLGVTGDCVCDILMSVHSEIKSAIWDSPASSVLSLLHAAALLSSQLQRGVDLPSALLQACGEAYALCQRTTNNQQLAQEVIERQLAVLDSEEWGSRLLCAGVWPDRVPSALQSTEDSCFASVQRDGQVLLYCLNTLSLQSKRSRPLSLTDLQRAMQSGAALEGLQFSGGGPAGGAEGGVSDAQQVLPTAVRILTERASHSDWVLRTSWLAHLAKSYKFVPGTILDDYRILVDMRWNKQYLDILANTCNFEDEERFFVLVLLLVSLMINVKNLNSLCLQILQLLQWRDRFWHVCNSLPADTRGVCVLSLHWQWVHKHLPVEELQLVWCELLSETLTSLWNSSVTSDPERWLKWSPLSPEEQKSSRSLLGPSDTGPGMLSRAVWSRCVLGVLSGSEVGGRWDPSGSSFLSSSRVTLGEWRERVGQLQDLSAVLWDNMAMPELADFRLTDCRLQGLVLCRQLHSLSDLLSPGLQESYTESCESLIDGQDPVRAAQEIQVALREGLPENLLPEGFLETLVTCLTQFSHNRVQDSVQLARSGVFWVNMGLLQIQVWAPQTIFDPAVKRAYKLSYAQEELALLQDEWRGRSLSSQLLTGAELEESSTTDAFQHPRIRYLQQICELGRKQACRPADPQYGRLYQELQHYLCSIGQPAAVGDLLSHLLKALQGPGPKSRPGIQGLLKEEAVWQASQQRFAQRLAEEYPLYPDVVVPLRSAILQLQHGMRLLASQVSSSLTALPGLPRLLSTLLAFPCGPLSSDLASADFLCSRACADVLRGLGKLLPAAEAPRVVPESAVLLLSALLRLQSHALTAGQLGTEACTLFRHVCQALVNEWDEQERRAREKEQREASLYRSRSRLHGGGLTEDQQEEREFRRSFPTYHKDFADITAEPSLEQPIIIEDDEDEVEETDSRENSGFRLTSCQNTIVQVHKRLCLSYARSLWYQPSQLTNQSKDHLSALVASYQITAPLIARFYHLMGKHCEMDSQMTGSQLLLSSLLQNTVRGSGGPAALILQSDGPYDFYREPNMSQARLCLPALEQLSRAVRQRLDDWPEHPALVQITVVMERVLAFSLSSPLAKFLNGLEILLSKAQDWENNASRSVSLRNELESITQLIIQWRKLELNCWSSSLDNAQKRHSENSNKHWFSIYQLIERYLQEKRTDSKSVLSNLLKPFFGSTVGEFHTRLAMLLAFHCHVLLAPKQEGQALLCSLLWNLHKYYSQFSDSVQSRVSQLRTPIEKELKDFVKISKWNDVSFWSIKQSVEKTHRTLFKFVKKFEAALSEPCAPCLIEQGSSAGMDSVDTQPEETPLHRLHQALNSSLPGRGRDLQVWNSIDTQDEVMDAVEPSSLQARLPILTKKMRKMCVQLVKTAPLPELSEDLDQFTGKEIITNVQALQSLTVDRSTEQERQKAEVKHILLQKQRALADLFKMLSQIGLSYRKGLTWARTADPEEPLCLQPIEMQTALSAVRAKEPLFAEMTSAWDGCQKYFYRSWARRNAMQAALLSAAKELGLGNVERCRGFSSHLFKLLLRQRRRLTKLTEHWVHLRKLIDSVQDVHSNMTSSEKEESGGLPPQDSLRSWLIRAQALSQQCSAALQQFSWVLQCCPEGPSSALSQAGQGEATLSHPSPLAPHLQPQACLMRRGEATWNEAVQRVELLYSESGFCLPQELMGGGDGEGATEFHDYEGGGIGEGEGVKDVSDKIENEDQVEDTFREGEDKEEKEPDDRDIKEEDNAIEMSEDFDGKMHDGEPREQGEDEEDSDEEQNEELDKKMGDLGDGPTDTLDERMWGDEDEDDDDLDGSDKEDESGAGMDQVRSLKVAAVLLLFCVFLCMFTQREFDENEVDPYHGKKEQKAEPEAMDLPEELNLDQGEQGGDDEEGEGDGELEEDVLIKGLVDEEAGEGEEEGASEIEMEDKQNAEGEGEEDQKAEEQDGEEQTEGDKNSEADEGGGSEEEGDEDEKERGQEEGKDDDKAIPADQGQRPKEEEQADEDNEDEDDDAKVESTERKEHATDGQTGDENVQSDTAVELAGAASERDQAKEEHGSGTADANETEGHDSKLMARMSSQRQRQKQTQVITTPESTNRQTYIFVYLHAFGLFILDAASAEQQRPSAMKQEDDNEEDDIAMDTDEEKELQAVEAPELKPEKMDGSKESAAAGMWQQYQALTSPLSQQLCEQLRLILEPTQAAKLKGDYRTGKRLNMRKVIPYIASQFRKDKIWLRRTKPSKRDYQICLAVDDSSSMVDNHSKQLAFESVSVIVNALTLLEVGQVAVCSFGESVQLLHPFHHQFNDQSGARILRLCQFQQKKTRIAQFLETSANMFVAAKQQNPETAQLLLIVSDGRGLFLEGKERVATAVQAARSANVFVIFVVLDNPNSRDSILDIKVPIFKGPGELPEIRSYMDEFPFPFYMILRDVNALPETLSDALRQWFELVTATDQ